MKVLVALKQVARLDGDFEVEDGSVPDRHLSRALNEWDDYALQAALEVAAAHADATVVAVTVGPERCEQVLHTALSRGADRAIRVWDGALAAAERVDPTTTGRLLAAVADREAPDLVVTGVQSSDDRRGATGVALAAAREVGWAAGISDLDVDLAAGEASVRRELEGGVHERLTVSLPAVVTVQTGVTDPPPSTAPDPAAPVTVLRLADLSFDPSTLGDGPTVRALRKPAPNEDCTRFEGPPDETAADLATVLRDAGVGAE
jgi:electron transfer flavoprotein beta subunit